MNKYYIIGGIIVAVILSAVNQKRQEIERKREKKIIDETVKKVFSKEYLDEIRYINRVLIEDFEF